MRGAQSIPSSARLTHRPPADAQLCLAFVSGVGGAGKAAVARRGRLVRAALGGLADAESLPTAVATPERFPGTPPLLSPLVGGSRLHRCRPAAKRPAVGGGLTGETVAAAPGGAPFDPAGTLAALEALPLCSSGQVVQRRHFAAIPPRHAVLAPPLPPPLASTAAALGLGELYSHQAEAIEAGRRGDHVVLSTSTSSGKSFVYNALVAERLLADPGAVAFYLFPTKALAQDQLRALKEMVACGWLADVVRPAVYDGDTSSAARSAARSSASIFLTNPDAVHAAILPHHSEWQQLLAKLRVVVLDEAHVYTGVFGAHVSNVLRRLVRLCRAHGNPGPQFVCCSVRDPPPRTGGSAADASAGHARQSP